MWVSRSVGVLMWMSRSVCTDQSDEPEDEREEDEGVGQQVATVGEPGDACPAHRHLHLPRPRRLPVHLPVLLHAHAQRGEADGGVREGAHTEGGGRADREGGGQTGGGVGG